MEKVGALLPGGFVSVCPEHLSLLEVTLPSAFLSPNLA